MTDTEERKTAPTLVERIKNFRPVKTWLYYSSRNGDLLAAGLTYQILFAVFAALCVAFAVMGLTLAGRPEIQKPIIDAISAQVPGLIGEGGAIKPSLLMKPNTLLVIGPVALVGLFFTALGWLASERAAIRMIADVPPPTTNALLLKLKDIGLALMFGLLILLSAGTSVLATSLMSTLLPLVGLSSDSIAGNIIGRGISILIGFSIDLFTLMGVYRLLSGLKIPFKMLFMGTLLPAAALTVLRLLSAVVLAGAAKNPLLASFGVIVTLLVWFNLVSRVTLIGAAWIAVLMQDHHIEPRKLKYSTAAKEAEGAEWEAYVARYRADMLRMQEEYEHARSRRRRRALTTQMFRREHDYAMSLQRREETNAAEHESVPHA